MCVCLIPLQNSLDFFFSNFRGSVPTPNINSPRYFTALEVQKDFELCEDYFKTAFRPYPEKR